MSTDWRVSISMSGNSCTGVMPVTTTGMRSCPETCPPRDGCYAKSGPIYLEWRKLGTAARPGVSWGEFCSTVEHWNAVRIWRHNQAGDLPHVNGTIDRELVEELAWSSRGRGGYTYTHHAASDENLETLNIAKRMGFVVSLSAEGISGGSAMMAHGLPVVTAVKHNVTIPRRGPRGERIVVCPAKTSDTTCVECRMCAMPERDFIIAFPAHGTRKNLVSQIVGE